MKPDTPELDVIVAPNGLILIHQGYYHQSLCVLREHLPRFLRDPNEAAILLISPFASAAVACYTTKSSVEGIQVQRDLTISEDYTLIITLTSGERIVYSSDPDMIVSPRLLAKESVNVLVTPMAIFKVHADEHPPATSVIASVPRAEKPNYSQRFAFPVSVIRDAVETALLQTKHSLRYEN